MCGIFAVTGTANNAGEQVLTGLKKLEYRGYDSWGVAVQAPDASVTVTKGVGKISDVNETFAEGATSIGHTRWATHGGIHKKNAHPHRVGRVTLAHNGIVENYEELKKKLSTTHTFISDTDSEILATLIAQAYDSGASPEEAIRTAVSRVDGRFAIVVMFDGVPGFFAARRGSPIIIGKSEDTTYLASDVPAFLEHTKTVNYVDDNEMASINGTHVHVTNLATGMEVVKRDIVVSWETEEVEKGNWPHFMIKEIFEQKETILRAINHPREIIKEFVTLLDKSKGVYLIASGTAHKVAMTAEYFFADIADTKINVVAAAEMPAFEKFVRKNTALLAISQSGETADVLEILERGKEKGARILAMTNVPSSSMARMSDAHLAINAGPEKAVASTKAATSQMALLLLCAYATSDTHVNAKDSADIGRGVLWNTTSAINDMLNPRYAKHIEKVAQQLASHKDLFIIGRGPLYPIALEAAIKIQEVSYIHAQGFAAGELKHGPIALIEEGTPCIVLGDDKETVANAIELKARGAIIIGIAPTQPDVYDTWIRVPDCNSAQAIASVIPVQLLSYYLARARDLDPDMPRNLAKSVTVK